MPGHRPMQLAMVRVLGSVAVMVLIARTATADGDVGTGAPPPSLEAMQARLEALEKTVAAQADALTEAQATAAAEAAAPTPEPTFEVHGFIDMGLQKTFTNAPDFSSTAATFVLGNVNL